MAIALPTAADVRKARKRVDELVSARYDQVRTPFMALVGANDLALTRLRELPERLSSDQLRASYDEWAERGEGTVQRIKKRPAVDKALKNVKDADKRAVRNLGSFADQVHDRGERLLGRETRPAAAPKAAKKVAPKNGAARKPATARTAPAKKA